LAKFALQFKKLEDAVSGVIDFLGTYDDDDYDNVYLDKLQTRGVKKSILYM
jgi:hypothetical protein